MEERTRFLGLGSGVGLVVANMIGAGVLLSAGFMAQAMHPGPILAAWVFGAVLALCGARAYGELATAVPRSGGEYRYLSELLHPALGYLAGWGSLLLGFAAPIALDAYAVGAFGNTLVDGPDPRLTGTVLIVVLALAHGVDLSWSKAAQNALVAVKLVGITAFVGVGLVVGARAWPTWVPPSPAEDPIVPFLENQFWIAFAFSGWNAATYAAGEFRDPGRDVPRAMWIGTALVSAIYLAVNWVLVANLTPDQMSVVFTGDTHRITLGHVVAEELVGGSGGAVMSVFVMVALTSAMSAMTLVGPRVYAEMAEDGYLPRALAGRPAPLGSVLLQSAIALALLHTHTVLEIVQSVSAILMAFTALCMVALFRLGAVSGTPASLVGKGAAAVYFIGALGILYFGFRGAPHLLGWVALVALLGLGSYAASRWRLGVGA